MERCAKSAHPVGDPFVAPTWEDIQPLVKIHRQQLIAKANAVVAGPAHAIYVGGSIADGYGNNRSDLDIYVLIDENNRPSSKRGFDFGVLNGKGLQFDFVSHDQLEAAIAQLETKKFEQISMNLSMNQILHRLCNAVVIDGGDTVAGYAERLRNARYLAFSSFVKQEQCENALQDAYGAWDAGQLETATFNLRLATHRAFEAVLSLCGQTATNEKWVFEKASRALGKSHPALAQFTALYLSMPSAFTTDGVGDYFERLLSFMQKCMDATLSSLLVPATPRVPFSRLGKSILASSAPAANRRNPRIHLRRVEGRNIVLESAVPGRELSDRAALVWICSWTCDDIEQSVAAAYGARPDLFVGEDVPSLAIKLEANWVRAGMLT